MTVTAGAEPYVPRLAVEWLRERPGARWHTVEGSLAFVDISGFTALTERLAAKGRVGAEELSDTLSQLFSELLAVAYRDGAGLLKWGGDALVLLFDGADHAARAVHAVVGMRARLAEVGRIGRGAARTTLRMSAGINSGRFHAFLVGDPTVHRELIVCGPAASRCTEMQAAASADEIAITAATAALIDQACVGQPLGHGFLVAGVPAVGADALVPAPSVDGLAIEMLIPPGIRERVCTSWGVAEHRRVAVGFVEFSGVDELITEQGPEGLADELDALVRATQQAAQRFGVTFFETDLGVDGGKIMLTAGAPTTAERDDERMLLAALEAVRHTSSLRLRAGVNRGHVFAGDFGAPFRRTYSVKGDAVNLAARLLGRAQPGELVATRDVLSQSTTEFTIDELAPFSVKGKSELVHAAVVGEPVHRSRDEASAFVGRANLLAELNEVIHQSNERRGSAIVISGPAGVGKSRILTEVVAAAGVRALVVKCDEYQRSTPYWSLRQLLQHALGVRVDALDGPVQARGELADERRGEIRNVLAPIAQRRQLQLHHGAQQTQIESCGQKIGSLSKESGQIRKESGQIRKRCGRHQKGCERDARSDGWISSGDSIAGSAAP